MKKTLQKLHEQEKLYFSRGNLTRVTRLTLLLKTSVSPVKYQKIAPCKGIQDSLWIRLRGFLIPDSRYRILASLSLEQSLVGFGILELYSGIQSLGFQIPQAKISQIPWTQTFKTVLRRISYGAGPLATSSLAVGRFAAKKRLTPLAKRQRSTCSKSTLDEENEQKKHSLRCGYTSHFTLV